MPPTKTPVEVYTGLISVFTVVGLLCALVVGLSWWSVPILLVTMAVTIGLYTENVPGYSARIIINQLTSRQRTLFQGLHLKLFWESVTQDIDLRVELKEVLTETYPSKDALMETKYIYTIRPNFSGVYAGENIVLYASYEEDAIKMEARALFSMLLSDYYGRNVGEDLKDKAQINQEAFGEGSGLTRIQEFEASHGVDVFVRLEDSDFTAGAQAARDALSRAKSFKEAVDILMQKGADGYAMDRKEAEKVAKLLNLPGVQEYLITLDAKGVENLRDVTFLGGINPKGGKK
ncbi:MAG: hypothetical protein UW07_C0008G0023 [Candidatus Nomurabacteria bacterium GW2011_GWF2_43_8]|uniref:Band 7 domain-containing protein n=2 Tax=Candidatus Nomuraibacteriota TaxID=1752729 RepID=A0A0G1FQN3_9BACT|nr:MAG: hypothetical protein UV76_C0015G0008 [Candidatus Nomurabacteria bacterium GW2011_GWA2_43_15]KKT24801.1 MAG: hypothetical protein UW07_C0008G0023 [Candidatus Nomurabacteria bacterium GW2011_GWF2_43_8]